MNKVGGCLALIFCLGGQLTAMNCEETLKKNEIENLRKKSCALEQEMCNADLQSIGAISKEMEIVRSAAIALSRKPDGQEWYSGTC